MPDYCSAADDERGSQLWHILLLEETSAYPAALLPRTLLPRPAPLSFVQPAPTPRHCSAAQPCSTVTTYHAAFGQDGCPCISIAGRRAFILPFSQAALVWPGGVAHVSFLARKVPSTHPVNFRGASSPGSATAAAAAEVGDIHSTESPRRSEQNRRREARRAVPMGNDFAHSSQPAHVEASPFP